MQATRLYYQESQRRSPTTFPFESHVFTNANVNLEIYFLLNSTRATTTRQQKGSQRHAKMMNIPSLPDELLLAILRDVFNHSSDIVNASLVCHHFSDLCRPLIFHEVWLVIHKRSDDDLRRLHLLARSVDENPKLAGLIRRLHLSNCVVAYKCKLSKECSHAFEHLL